MYIFFIVLIVIASILMILAVLAQSPKSGMAANFGASNQVMGVRQTTDFLEKFTWTMAIAIVILSMAASIAMASHRRSANSGNDTVIEQVLGSESAIPNAITAPVAAEADAETPVEAAAEQSAE